MTATCFSPKALRQALLSDGYLTRKDAPVSIPKQYNGETLFGRPVYRPAPPHPVTIEHGDTFGFGKPYWAYWVDGKGWVVLSGGDE